MASEEMYAVLQEVGISRVAIPSEVSSGECLRNFDAMLTVIMPVRYVIAKGHIVFAAVAYSKFQTILRDVADAARFSVEATARSARIAKEVRARLNN